MTNIPFFDISNSSEPLALVSVIWVVNGHVFGFLTMIVIDMESFVEDVGHLSIVTKLAHHVVEVRNL